VTIDKFKQIHACKLCIRQLLAIIRLPEVEGTKLQQKIEPKINDDEGYPVIRRRIIGIYNGTSVLRFLPYIFFIEKKRIQY